MSQLGDKGQQRFFVTMNVKTKLSNVGDGSRVDRAAINDLEVTGC